MSSITPRDALFAAKSFLRLFLQLWRIATFRHFAAIAHGARRVRESDRNRTVEHGYHTAVPYSSRAYNLRYDYELRFCELQPLAGLKFTRDPLQVSPSKCMQSLTQPRT